MYICHINTRNFSLKEHHKYLILTMQNLNYPQLFIDILISSSWGDWKFVCGKFEFCFIAIQTMIFENLTAHLSLYNIKHTYYNFTNSMLFENPQNTLKWLNFRECPLLKRLFWRLKEAQYSVRAQRKFHQELQHASLRKREGTKGREGDAETISQDDLPDEFHE